MRYRPSFGPRCAAAALIAASSVGLAQTPPSRSTAPASTATGGGRDAEVETEARARFGRGVALFDARQFEGALAEFRAAYDLSRRPTVLYNIGATLQALYRYAEAANALGQFLREMPSLSAARRAEVERGLEEIRAFVAHVTLRGVPDGARVTLDGERVGLAPLPGALDVSTGRHTVEVFADGFETARETFSIAGGQSRDVTMVMRPGGTTLAFEDAPDGAEIEVDGGVWPARRTVGVTPGAHAVRISAAGFLAYRGSVDVPLGARRVARVQLAREGGMGPAPSLASAGVTVALGLTSLAFGVNSLSTHAEFRRLTQESPGVEEISRRGETQQTLANVFLIATGVAGVVTVFLLAGTRFGPAHSTLDVALVPDPAGGAHGSVRVRF